MARPKSLILNIEWTQAGRTHDCRHSKSHRIEKGDRRLTIRVDGDKHHYCMACGRCFLAADIKRLEALLAEAEATR